MSAYIATTTNITIRTSLMGKMWKIENSKSGDQLINQTVLNRVRIALRNETI